MRALGYVAASLILLASAPAAAEDYGTCCGNTVRWLQYPQTFKLLPVSFNCGTSVCTSAHDRFVEAVAGWNDVMGAQLKWTVAFDDDNNSTSRGDGNEVGFSSKNSPVGILAETHVSWGVCGFPFCDEGISEADMVFYIRDENGNPITWAYNVLSYSYFTRDVPDPNGDPFPATSDQGTSTGAAYFIEVASHEIGHASGFNHHDNNVGGSRMDDRVPNGGWYDQGPTSLGREYRVTPLPFDHKEMRRLYPTSGANADVILLSWQGSLGNTIPTTALWGGGDQSAYPFNNAPGDQGNDDTLVRPGDKVNTRVCLGNTGSVPLPVYGMNFYLSTDLELSTSDAISPTGWGWGTTPFAANSFWCETVWFTVPSGLPGGWKFLGMWLDTVGDHHASAPNCQSNDCTFMGRRVRYVP